MKNIYIVGFMGTGKSVVSRDLAVRLNRKAVELDELIENKEKRKINDIFTRDGESYFRRLESQALSEVSRSYGLVVSCGGGIVLNEANIKIMKETGIVICLSASPDVILKRTSHSNHRPLLNIDNPRLKIEELLNQRAPFYAKADHAIDSSCLDVKGVVDIIIKDIVSKC
ncbi:MAG TPA: shikimate kinase [Candidatus Omnitrophica bacterium]|nr:shikimate kinase [Candidatus Omnitrophota bacterium]